MKKLERQYELPNLHPIEKDTNIIGETMAPWI